MQKTSSKHTTLKQLRINVERTLLERTLLERTLLKRHVPAGLVQQHFTVAMKAFEHVQQSSRAIDFSTYMVYRLGQI